MEIYCCINSACIWGIEPYIVKIESDISAGLPCFNMVGLLASEVKESKERVRTALKNSGEDIPIGRITVNLSPADRRKEGTGFDLPIAVSLLCAMGRIDYKRFQSCIVIGELGLDGEIKPVRGILPIVTMAHRLGIEGIIVPAENREEAMIFDGIRVKSCVNLRELIEWDGRYEIHSENDRHNVGSDNIRKVEEGGIAGRNKKKYRDIRKDRGNKKDYSQIMGQEFVKRAVTIAAAGWHNILMIGAPGVGKSMIASRIPGIMPELTLEERLEITSIHSICGILKAGGLVDSRPFSAPHHSITSVALIGGGRNPMPGEITIAHNGVLFLDELPEFQANVLEALRQPLEDREVKINRITGRFVFPANCLLVAAMNPCRCGYYPDRNRCNCSESEVRNYMARISGPMLDRMDMCVEVPRVDISEIDNDISMSDTVVLSSVSAYSIVSDKVISDIRSLDNHQCKDINEDKINVSKECSQMNMSLSSADMKAMVEKAVLMRQSRGQTRNNSQLGIDDIRRYCVLDKDGCRFIKQAYNKFNLSMRGYYKIIKVARTIADMEGEEYISVTHLSEALAFRMSDMKRGGQNHYG